MRETAEPAGSVPTIGRAARLDAVLQLAWLAPSAASLAALGRPPTPLTWSAVRGDPGAVLLVARWSDVVSMGRSSSAPSFTFPAQAFHESGLFDEARRFLDQDGFVSWDKAEVRPVYEACLTYARLARHLAQRTGRCDPERAWVCGMLAPLGWLALSACDPTSVSACLGDPAFRSDPGAAQRRHWRGLDQGAIARRLGRRWNLPSWLTSVLDNLPLPAAVAQTFGADPLLLSLTRLAIEEGRRRGFDLGLTDGSVTALDSQAVLDESAPFAWEELAPSLPLAWEDPRQAPFLADLLAVAAENRRLRAEPRRVDLEQEIDTLHTVLEKQIHGETQRLQDLKLAALAEFAAGAGHEINNPLAVISGQAQYLLGHQSDWFPGDAEGAVGKALQAIIAQTRRIHGALRDLMQFARPGVPCPVLLDLPILLGEVAASVGELASQRRVRVELVIEPERLPIYADACQVRLALSCLLRNAVEAVLPDGWARLVLRHPLPNRPIEVVVEDSGPGPEPSQRPHLFDPFYSGRTAGRGRGLGLPIAWRLARQQGGTVRLDDVRAAGPTRFILTLPPRDVSLAA